MLLDTLRRDQLAARKAKNATEAALLTTLVSEAVMVGKNAKVGDEPDPRDPTDAEVLATVRKFLKNAGEMRAGVLKRDGEMRAGVLKRDGEGDALEAVNAEIVILGRYLPQQLSDDALTGLIETFVAANPGAKIGQVMGFLAKEHRGLYDGKRANTLASVTIAAVA